MLKTKCSTTRHRPGATTTTRATHAHGARTSPANPAAPNTAQTGNSSRPQVQLPPSEDENSHLATTNPAASGGNDATFPANMDTLLDIIRAEIQ